LFSNIKALEKDNQSKEMKKLQQIAHSPASTSTTTTNELNHQQSISQQQQKYVNSYENEIELRIFVSRTNS